MGFSFGMGAGSANLESENLKEPERKPTERPQAFGAESDKGAPWSPKTQLRSTKRPSSDTFHIARYFQR